MATPTDAELLDACKAAIRSVLAGGQQAQWDGHMVTMADLPKLREARAELERRLSTTNRQAAGDYDATRSQQARFVR